MLVTTDGWVKRQKEIKEPSKTRLREGDSVMACFAGSTRASAVFFSNFGSAYTARIIDLPATTGHGVPIQTLFKLKDGERLVSAFSLDPRAIGNVYVDEAHPDYAPETHAIAVASDGYSFRFGLQSFVEPSTRNGRRFGRLGTGAVIMGVQSIHGDETLMVATEKARVLLCSVVEVNYLEGVGRGTILIKLGKGDRVLGFLAASEQDRLTVVTNRGAEKTISPARYERTSRAGRGRELLKNGTLVALVRPEVQGPEPFDGSEAGSGAETVQLMSTYTAKDITVLQGLEPVRKRPGMYIGGVSSQGLHHLVWEILDNSVDEAMNGYATAIQVTLHADGSSLTVSDDGRGIPVDKHPRAKKSALEVILTTLHAGGKFEGQNYKTAGGLHGVGASVVNALSSSLVATVKRDGAVFEMKFKAGKPTGALKKIGRGRGSGTTITFHPDPKIFPKTKFQPEIDPRPARDHELPAQGPSHHLDGRDERREDALPARGGSLRLPRADSRGAEGQARPRASVRARTLAGGAGGHPHRARGEMDRVHGRARPKLRQRHPHELRRLSRERLPLRPRQSDPELRRGSQALPQGSHPHVRRHSRRARRGALRLRDRSSVPGPDERPAQQPRGAAAGRQRRAARARALAEPEPLYRRSDRRPDHPCRPGAGSLARRLGRDHPQVGHEGPAPAARQAERLYQLALGRRPSSSSSRETRREARRSRGATGAGRPCFRCAARS